jgi:hypothetical protein
LVLHIPFYGRALFRGSVEWAKYTSTTLLDTGQKESPAAEALE